MTRERPFAEAVEGSRLLSARWPERSVDCDTCHGAGLHWIVLGCKANIPNIAEGDSEFVKLLEGSPSLAGKTAAEVKLSVTDIVRPLSVSGVLLSGCCRCACRFRSLYFVWRAEGAAMCLRTIIGLRSLRQAPAWGRPQYSLQLHREPERYHDHQ